MEAALACSSLVVALLLPACGGGGGGGGGTTSAAVQTVKVDIAWPDRSRSINGPNSALSAVVKLHGAGPDGSDFSFSFDRDGGPAAHITEYTSATAALTGNWPMSIRFFANPGATGDLVGAADATVQLASDGSLKNDTGADLGAITPSMSVASVELLPGQSVNVGEHKDIAFTARDANNQIVAVTPGSALFSVTNGASFLQFAGGQAEGLAPGTATVTATVDGKVSPAVSVEVTSQATVSIDPPTVSLSIGGSQTFSATVTGAANTAVTWTVQEPGGGTVAANGIYTAPANPGTYHIVATSLYDPKKSAVATVTAQSGSASGTIQ